MKHTKLICTVAAAALFLAAPLGGSPAQFLPIGTATAQAQQAHVSFNIFFDRLSSHGTWVKSARHRYVWCPDVASDWAPYTRGHWVHLADRGWYFASDEPFAWAVYHYGRWYVDADLGWCWVPGNVWAPAWVTWRRGDDYVGWAPLPPANEGYSVGVSVSKSDVPQRDWVFVPAERFLQPNLRVSVVFGSSKPDVWRRTKPVGPVVVKNNIVVNNVININFIEQHTHHKVKSVQAKMVDRPDAASSGQGQGQSIQIFAANLQKPSNNEAPKQAVDKNQARQKLGNRPRPGNDQNPPTPADQTQNGGAAQQSGSNDQTSQQSQGGNQQQTSQKPGNQPSANGNGNNQQGQKPNGKAKPAKCLPKDMVNGVCPPAKSNNTSSADKGKANSDGASGSNNADNGSSKSGSSAPAQDNQQNAPAANNQGNAKNGNGAKNANADKSAACAADERLVNGRCVPAGQGKPGAGSNDKQRPQPARSMNNGSSDSGNGAPAANAAKPKPETAPSASAQGNGNGNGNGNGLGNDQKVAKCPPSEVLVRGVCQPRKGGNGGGAENTPNQ